MENVGDLSLVEILAKEVLTRSKDVELASFVSKFCERYNINTLSIEKVYCMSILDIPPNTYYSKDWRGYYYFRRIRA